ncbi:TlpA family protein disulfide reductase [bacterium]|nr:TlpA family protein disulfide reductase [bacterium]
MANEIPKRSSQRDVILGLLALGLVLSGIGLLVPYRSPENGPLVGQPVPPLAFRAPGQAPRSVSELRGKTVLIVFWAYWCEPCLAEMESLQALEQQMEGQPFVLWMVHVGQGESIARGIPFLPKNLLFGNTPEELEAFRFNGLPHTVLVDQEGIIRAEYEGPRNWASPEAVATIKRYL